MLCLFRSHHRHRASKDFCPPLPLVTWGTDAEQVLLFLAKRSGWDFLIFLICACLATRILLQLQNHKKVWELSRKGCFARQMAESKIWDLAKLCGLESLDLLTHKYTRARSHTHTSIRLLCKKLLRQILNNPYPFFSASVTKE